MWLKGRSEEGRNVKVAVGCPGGVVFYHTPEEWESGLTAEQFHARLMTRATAAAWIEVETMGRIDAPRNKAG